MNVLHKVSLLVLSIILLISCNSQSKIITQTKIIRDSVFIDINPKYQVVTSADVPGYVISKKNFPSNSFNNRIRYLIMHYTVSDYPTSIKILTKKNVSAHYLVNNLPNDSIDILVSEDKRAYHAGISAWGTDEKLNDTSIGIEIVNKGFTKVKDSLVYEAYPYFQIEKVAALAKNIIKRYDIDPTNVLGHSDIAPLRKQDPGPMFPWKMLYDKYQIGAWYDEPDKQKFLTDYDETKFPYNSILEFQKALEKYGYKIDKTGTLDKNTQAIITAFQYHFRPKKSDGKIDAESWAIIQALNLKYKK